MATGYEPLDTLKQVDRNVWLIDGPRIYFYGMPFSTRATVIRLPDGVLWVHSPTRLTETLRAEIDALGPVAHLIAPNWLHYAYLADWQSAFPNAVSWAAPGVVARAARRGLDLSFVRNLGATAPPQWADSIDQLMVEGSRIHRECVFFHRASGTLILTDLIENFEADKLPRWFRLAARLAGVLHPDGKMPIDMRLSFLGGYGRLRAAIEHMIAWAPRRIIVAHGRLIDGDAVSELQRAFRFVLG